MENNPYELSDLLIGAIVAVAPSLPSVLFLLIFYLIKQRAIREAFFEAVEGSVKLLPSSARLLPSSARLLPSSTLTETEESPDQTRPPDHQTSPDQSRPVQTSPDQSRLDQEKLLAELLSVPQLVALNPEWIKDWSERFESVASPNAPASPALPSTETIREKIGELGSKNKVAEWLRGEYRINSKGKAYEIINAALNNS